MKSYKLVLDGDKYRLTDERGESIPNAPEPNSDRNLYLKELSKSFTSPCIQAFREGYTVHL